MLLDHDTPPLPPRYDPVLGAGAAAGLIALIVFCITECDPGLRIHGDARFAVVQWCECVAVPCVLSWLLRPRITHLAYALKLGRALAVLPDAPEVASPRTFADSRWVWCCCGTIAACSWALAAGIDLAALTGLLDLHGVNLSITTDTLSRIGSVCAVVRVVGTSLATVDDIYDLARLHCNPGATIYDFGARAHG